MIALFGYAAAVAISLWCLHFFGLTTGALYIPTDKKRLHIMLSLAELKPEDRVVDIGSGDGRLVIAAALQGIPAVGYEINPLLVWISRRKARKAGVSHLATFHAKNFWKVSLSSYSVVCVFGIKHIMPKLEKKLERELQPGSRVVCNLFPLPHWKGKEDDGVYAYER